ncbi:MAG: hypothetical protein JWO80_5586, partial [Bryobacterales bacterium]|nr:hypothetical protein [Bryobacterales bacterium]
MAKVVAILSTSCLLFLLIAGVAYVRFFVPGGAIFHQTLDAPELVKEVRSLNDLVTVRYSIQKVVGMKQQRSPVGEESILLMVQGRVLAGIDLTELTQYDVTMKDRQTAQIRLAPPRITDAFLDEKETKVWDRKITWWTPWISADPDLEHKARLLALDEVRAAAIQMGILRDARKNAEEDVRRILHAFGIGRVTFVSGS